MSYVILALVCMSYVVVSDLLVVELFCIHSSVFFCEFFFFFFQRENGKRSGSAGLGFKPVPFPFGGQNDPPPPDLLRWELGPDL